MVRVSGGASEGAGMSLVTTHECPWCGEPYVEGDFTYISGSFTGTGEPFEEVFPDACPNACEGL